MASTTGLGNISGSAIASDLLTHLTPPNATPVATAISIVGPLNLSLSTTAHSNTVPGTECADTHYLRSAGAITAWNAITVTAGAGYPTVNNGATGNINAGQAGFAIRTSNVALTMLNSTGVGATAAASLTGTALYDSTGTPIFVSYLNFSATIVVPIGNTYTVASGSVSLQLT